MAAAIANRGEQAQIAYITVTPGQTIMNGVPGGLSP